MAVVIPTQIAQVSPIDPNYPMVQVKDYVGDALQSVGASVSSAANRDAAENERAKAHERAKQNLNAQLELANLSVEADRDLVEVQRNAPADGTGIEQEFVTKRLAPKADKFLAGITDPELKEEWKTRIDIWRKEQENRANDLEYKQGNSHSLNGLQTLQGNAGRTIAADPTSYDAITKDFESQIDKAPLLTPAQREELKAKWREQAPELLAESLRVNDPQTLYYMTGNGTADERSSYLSDSLVRAVAQAESSGGLNVVSPKGALGILQVMPDTALEIAKEIGDQDFLSAPPAMRRQMLLSDSVNLRYGQYYLNKMLKQNGGDLQLALIAYNAGQGRANEFVKAGRDWSKVGKWADETQPYVQKIFGLMGSKALAGAPAASMSAAGPQITGARLPAITGTQAGRQPLQMDGLNKTVIDKWELTQGAFGSQVPIVSAFRDPFRNKSAGGAKHSQHMHGNAIDLDVSSMSKADRVRLIETASAAGFTGIGVYGNSIHLDIGARRAWGPTHHGDSVPGWAREAINRHMNGDIRSTPGAGSAVAGGAGVARGASSPPLRVADAGTVQSDAPAYVSSAFAGMSPAALVQAKAQSAAAVRAMPGAKQAEDILKFQTTTMAANDIAAVEQTGTGAIAPGQVNEFEQNLLTAHGADAVLKYRNDKAQAAAVYEYTKNLSSMTDKGMAERLEQLKPKGGPDAVAQQAVYDKVESRVKAEQTARAKDPAEYVMRNNPEVRQAWQNAGPANMDAVRAGIAATIDAQVKLGIPADKIMPLPEAAAAQFAGLINDPKQSADTRINTAVRIITQTPDVGQQMQIIKQLAKSGVSPKIANVMEAVQRNDTGAARRLFQAAIVDPDKVPRPEKDEPGFNAAVEQAMVGVGSIGEAYYGLDAGDPATVEIARSDIELAKSATRFNMLSGMDQETAMAQAVKDIFGNVERIDDTTYAGAKVRGIVEIGTDKDALLKGMYEASKDVKAALATYADRAKATLPKDATPEQINLFSSMAGTQSVATLANGQWRNYGSGWGFFDPGSGAFVMGADGKPLLFTTDDLLKRGSKADPAAGKPAFSSPAVPPRQDENPFGLGGAAQ